MFEKLVESNSEAADFKDRRKYFVTSAVIVGLLFITAVVISIYAEDFTLGNDQFELEAMMAPVEMAPSEPVQPQPRTRNASAASDTSVPLRQVNMASTNDPTVVPTGTSVAQNAHLSRPNGVFLPGPDSDPGPGTGRGEGAGGGIPAEGPPAVVAAAEPDRDPPAALPVVKPPARTVSLGVVNGKASYLPAPPYPAPAIAVNAQGKVEVQVTIDETGKVVSARAMSGNVLLRGAAEQAALRAKFTPTLLSKVPVKAMGIIVYNFTRS